MTVLNWFSRYVLAWELDQTLEMPFVLAAVDRALVRSTPTICISDQGSHFTSLAYLERLWRTVKYEEVYLHEYEYPRAARGGLAAYFEFYSQERLHSR